MDVTVVSTKTVVVSGTSVVSAGVSGEVFGVGEVAESVVYGCDSVPSTVEATVVSTETVVVSGASVLMLSDTVRLVAIVSSTAVDEAIIVLVTVTVSVSETVCVLISVVIGGVPVVIVERGVDISVSRVGVPGSGIRLLDVEGA